MAQHLLSYGLATVKGYIQHATDRIYVGESRRRSHHSLRKGDTFKSFAPRCRLHMPRAPGCIVILHNQANAFEICSQSRARKAGIGQSRNGPRRSMACHRWDRCASETAVVEPAVVAQKDGSFQNKLAKQRAKSFMM